MVPNIWEQKTFKEILKLDRGSSPRPIVNFITDSDDGVNWIKIGDTKGNNTFVTSTKQKITKEGAKKSKKVSKGEIILSNSMSYGKPYILSIDGYIHDGWFVIREYEKNLDKGYLIQLLGSEIIQHQYKRMAAGGVVTNISSEIVYSVSVAFPALPEQRKIAKILGTWDKAISTTERLIDNSKQQKKALMQQLLSGVHKGKRLLDDSGKPFVGEWEEVTVGNLGEIYSGGTPSTSNEKYWNGDIDWITPTDITKQNSVYINSSVRKISSEGLKNSSAKLVPKGSLLVCTRATIGEMAITSHEMCTNQGFKNIIPNKNTNVEFVFYLLTYEKHKLVSKASGSTFLELSKSSFESIKFNVPLIDEQQKIASVLTNADKETELLEQQLDDLKQEKKALMQQLLTGKRRVIVDKMVTV